MNARPVRLKDKVLADLADRVNVAQFISFAPGPEFPQRFCRIRGWETDFKFADPTEALEALLSTSASKSVNVRTFHTGERKGGAFHYGLRTIPDVIAVLRREAQEGLYTLVNETIDIHDGGVSGVMLGGVLELAPDDTPRCVEKPGIASFEQHSGLRILRTVYGFDPLLDEYKLDERVEFSLHPLRVGYRLGHTIIWEVERVEDVELSATLSWPNQFSRLMGDKAFGLLVGNVLDFLVPATTVISRRIPPFHFGESTGTGEFWLRTCPVEQVAGRFTTQRGWTDPMRLLASEDPDGTTIASVLSQEGVAARYSGATLPAAGAQDVVEGVQGFGEAFMQGQQPPERLPSSVVSDVRTLAQTATDHLGPVRMEWVHDGERPWVVQLHLATPTQEGVIYPGEAGQWQPYDPSEGLERLRKLVLEAATVGEGVIVTGPVGVTSHVGDILRKARVPSRLAFTASP